MFSPLSYLPERRRGPAERIVLFSLGLGAWAGAAVSRPGWPAGEGPAGWVLLALLLALWLVACRALATPDRDAAGRERADEERVAARRPLTPAEAAALGVLAHAAAVLCRWLPAIWEGRVTRYTTGESRCSHGIYFNGWGRPYRHEEVFLAESLFTRELGAALATYLHEHAHLFGTDGSRRFTDELTCLIEGVVTHRRHLDACEAQWETARERVLAERLARPPVPAQDAPRGASNHDLTAPATAATARSAIIPSSVPRS